MDSNEGKKLYTIDKKIDEVLISLVKPEAIYSESFIPEVSAFIRDVGSVKINCGLKSTRAQFIVSELISDDFLNRIYAQDHVKESNNEERNFNARVTNSIQANDLWGMRKRELIFVEYKKIAEAKTDQIIEMPDENKPYIIPLGPSPNNSNPFIFNTNLGNEFKDQVDFQGFISIPYVEPIDLDDKEKDKFWFNFDTSSSQIPLSEVPLDPFIFPTPLQDSNKYIEQYFANNYQTDFEFSNEIYPGANSLAFQKDEFTIEGYGDIASEIESSIDSILTLVNAGRIVEINKKDFLENVESQFELRKDFTTNELIIDQKGIDTIETEEFLIPIVISLVNRGHTVVIDLGIQTDPEISPSIDSSIFESINFHTGGVDVSVESRILDGFGLAHSVLVIKP